MGTVIRFPRERARISADEANRNTMPCWSNPAEMLEHFLELAKSDTLIYLAVHAYRLDGLYMHAEMGLGVDTSDEDSPITDVEVDPTDCA